MTYLEQIISKYAVSPQTISSLQKVRDELEAVLRGNWKTGDPRFYYGGSYAKNTMVNLSFDLDLVVYFPPTDQFTVKVLYESIEARLLAKGYKLSRHNVALRLPYTEGFYVDVVPGRAHDNTYLYANLYVSEADTIKQTSIKTHINLVRKNGGYQDVVKLLKIWKVINNLDVRSFVLELATDVALKGNRNDLDKRFFAVLEYLRDSFRTARLVDPANSNNIVSDGMSATLKDAVARAASTSCAQQNWGQIVW